MSTANVPRAILKAAYAKAAQEYLRSLPLEHFMEATAQATQREITVASLALLKRRRGDVQYFNELLVQYPFGRHRRPRQVVPDNMVVIWAEPIDADLSYDVPLQPVGPFWTLEYVSKHNQRKDYEGSFQEYELKVPYYLVFHPEKQQLTLYQHGGRKYRKVPANERGRYPIAELDLEVGLLAGWVRFWYQGQLLPLPADLQQEPDEARQQLADQQRRVAQEQQRATEAARQAADLQQQLDHE